MLEFPPSLISPTSTVGDSEPKIPTILVDSREACLNEAGELIAARIEKGNLIEIGELCKEDGTLREDAATEEKLSRLRAGPGRRSLFKCVGVGAMDVAVTKLVVDEAIKQGRGTLVDF
jgi:ornithine cyclodeaminase